MIKLVILAISSHVISNQNLYIVHLNNSWMHKKGLMIIVHGATQSEHVVSIVCLFLKIPWPLFSGWSEISRKQEEMYLKLVSPIFIKFLFFHQMVALQKLWKMLFISSKKLFSFLRYSIFCISDLASFSTCQPLL